MQKVVRDQTTFKATKRTIVSGTLVSSRTGGSIENSFENVVYETSEPCMPTSGTITGSLFKEGEDGAKNLHDYF